MSPLEKMARAMIEDIRSHPRNPYIEADDDSLSVTVDGIVDVRSAARAALLAIREPDREMTLAMDRALQATGSRPGAFAAAIDAILAEEPRP